MTDNTPNIKLHLDLLRKSVSKEITALRQTLNLTDAPSAALMACLSATEHQLKSALAYWSTDCQKAYRRSGATSHLFQENAKRLIVTLRDTNEPVKGKDQNEVFANAIKSLGLKACYDACKKGSVYAVKTRKELLVDTKPQVSKHAVLVEKNVTYYVYTTLSANDKVKCLKHLAPHLNCDIHASYE